MRKVFSAIVLLLCTFSLTAQKVWIQITNDKKAAEATWQVLDEHFNPVFASNEYLEEDSIPFTLESNKRYLLELSVSKIINPDALLVRLYINSEPVLFLKTNIGEGDHFYYFFTGVREGPAKITGGLSTLISSFPWQVYLEAGSFVCGGSIIAGDWIITAAHCTEDDAGNLIPADQMSITVGANDQQSVKAKSIL